MSSSGELRADLVADLESDRIELAEAVRALGDYCARFVTWDEVAVNDVVLSQSGLAEVIAAGPPDPEPDIAIRWILRSLHNGAEYETAQVRGWLTAVVRRGQPSQEEAGATVLADKVRIHVVTLAGLLDGMRKIDFRPGFEFSEYWRQLQEATTAIAGLLPENAAGEEPR